VGGKANSIATDTDAAKTRPSMGGDGGGLGLLAWGLIDFTLQTDRQTCLWGSASFCCCHLT